MSRSVIKTFVDERLLGSNLGISFFPSYRFGVAVKGNSIVLETYPSPLPNTVTKQSTFGTFGLREEGWWVGCERLIDYLQFGFSYSSYLFIVDNL